MPVRTLEHTADIGIEIAARNISALFEEAIIGMVALCFDQEGCAPTGSVVVAGTGADAPETLVSLPSEVLSEMEISDRVPVTAETLEIGPGKAMMSCRTALLDRSRVVGPAIKAVTYHGLRCEPGPSRSWWARVFFDV